MSLAIFGDHFDTDSVLRFYTVLLLVKVCLESLGLSCQLQVGDRNVLGHDEVILASKFCAELFDEADFEIVGLALRF